jgi:uncharacterized membrane protein
MAMHIRTARMESFSDGVIAIIITVMVFDIKFRELAHGFTHHDVINGFQVLWPKIGAYAFSFLVLGTMWLNHHHMFHLVQIVDEKLMWFNLNFLFWLSLIPLPTSMIGRNPYLAEGAALYAAIMFLLAGSFMLMRGYVHRKGLMRQDDRKLNKELDKVNRRVKMKSFIGLLAYLAAIPLAYVSVFFSYALFLVPVGMFFIPDGVAEASDDTPVVREESRERAI